VTTEVQRAGASHETLWRAEPGPVSSDRSFGLTFAGVLSAIAAISLWRGLERGVWELVLAAVFLIVAWISPGLLSRLNRAWAWIGRGLNSLVSPLLIIVLFYGVVTPVGLAMRAFGQDPLRLRRGAKAATYWIDSREGSEAPDMRRQF
jgi:hypothetical protein